MYNQIRVTTNRRSEVSVKLKTQAEVTDVIHMILGLTHRAQSEDVQNTGFRFGSKFLESLSKALLQFALVQFHFATKVVHVLFKQTNRHFIRRFMDAVNSWNAFA
ncbi:hypothetical protein D3C87_1374220 [compost metagenome]